ncbi:MAG: hypothetical protein KDA22_02055, partial [Phycisphaerales bacterium]|nr:hypothetical protein [Phycisphaerales bacterium]
PNGEPDPFLRELLDATEPEELAVGGPDLVADRDLSGFDLLVLDRVALPALPPVPSITFGAAPPGVSERAPASPGGRRLLAWERRNPLLRFVPLDGLVYARFGAFELPEDAEVLATGPDGPVMAILTQRGVRHAFIGFPLRQSNLPVLPGFPVLMQNALDYLGAAGAGMVGAWTRTGAPFAVEALPGATEVTVRSIDDQAAIASTTVRTGQPRVALPGIANAGIYRIEGGSPALVTVNMASAVETDIRIRPDLAVAVSGGGERAVPVLLQRDLWPWFVWALVALLIAEWALYLWRARSR